MAPLPAPSGPRGEILTAIRQRLFDNSPARKNVFLNRTEPLRVGPSGEELPALVVHEIAETSQVRTKTPRAYTRTLRIGVAVYVARQPFFPGQTATGQNLSPSETQRRAELCKAVEDALLSDPKLEVSSGGKILTGDCEYVGTQFSQEAKVEIALASALVMFEYTYVTEHQVPAAIGAVPLKTVHADYKAPAPQLTVTATDDIGGLQQ